MIVVDTSVWIAFFRSLNPRVVVQLRDLLDAERVALAAPVRVELLAGASRRDHRTLERLLSALPVVYPKQETWRRIDVWIASARKAGEHFGFADLLIGSLAADEGATVWSLDRDFGRLARLGFIKTHAMV